MAQTKLESAIEAVANVLIGYFVAVISQMVIFPIFGIYVGIMDNLLISLYFTCISVVRSYIVRRWFNE